MMPRVDKTMLMAVLAGAAIAAVSASCANSCSGHGSCGTHDRCSCYAMWTGTDCSQKVCPSGPSFTSDGYEVCSGRGVCDGATGTCACSEGYTGYNCGRTACPNDCSGHGKCTSAGVDGGMTRACVCDGYYSGADCSFRQCPRGDDPLTTEIECQGVASGAQSHEVQEITLTADKQLSGEMTLTYTDAYGQAWTTMPIAVGGDLEYDLRMSGSGGCSLTYHSATLTSEKFRSSDAKSTDNSDFGATEFSVPGVLADTMTATDCDTLSAADMQALLEQNGVVKNVKVTKSEDASTGTARFHVSFGDLNFQNENDGMEVGVFSLSGSPSAGVRGPWAGAFFHSVGDRSQAIKDALQALPYNVVPSVDVSRVNVDGGSDYADSTVVYGNMVQQKYRITFSDAANAGDQVSLQCNAEGCDADGCAPRYKGVTHKRYISTKYGSDPMDPTGGVTDYRTAIVATGQGSWWLRSHSLDTRVTSPFTSGTYHVHWDLGNGEVSSASFAYNADQAAIQTALRTIEGWSGVSVSCFGTPGLAGRDVSAAGSATTAVAASKYGLECKVTYAKGFDDGGKLPTMTYTNIHQGMDAAVDGSGTKTHFTNIGDSNDPAITFDCVNEMCLIKNIGYANVGQTDASNGDYTSFSLFTGAHGTKASLTSRNLIEKQDNWIGYVYIRHADADKAFPLEGTYEIVRVGSSSHLNTAGTADLIIYAPGVADMNKATAFGTGDVYLYRATPLMPMWPSYSNSIALHDSSFRLVLAPEKDANGVLKPLHSAASLSEDTWSTGNIANIVYGPYGAAASGTFTLNPNQDCSTVLDRLDGFVVAEPYPSLSGICDCKRTTMEVAPFEVEYTLTCPGWLGYLLNNDGDRDSTATGGFDLQAIEGSSDNDLNNKKVLVFGHHRRLAPERSLEQLVAVGDTVTVTASGANTNKQFKVQSFAFDNMWGDGGKGSAIWSAKAGYLGGDNAKGFGSRSGFALSATVDYVSYGDFVPFLKVDPAPSDDYGITEMYTEGTNGTHFTRTLEDISTSLAETATLKIYDMPATEGTSTRTDNVYADASQLSGTFQLIYDGELSPVMPVTSSANQVMEYLSQMTTLTHVPIVKKYCGGLNPTVALGDTIEAVTANADYVSWTFTFDPRLGDAKKLTFKFTDALGDEQKTSAIKGSGDTYLKNEAKTLLNVGANAQAGANKGNIRYVSNKIIMTYSSGSTFYDSIDDEYSGDGSASDGHTEDDKVQDELSMDVVPGTTFKVSSAEVHHTYMYQTVNEAAGDANTEPIKGCTTTAGEGPHVVVEYDGAFSQAVSLCDGGSASKWEAPADMVTAITDDITALAGLSIAVTAEVVTTAVTGVTEDAGINNMFVAQFPWAATHSGSARARISFTLPMGAKGDTFKVHFQRGSAKASGEVRFAHASADKNNEFKIFTHRERNNNGRTFTVTKAYENKVSDLLSVSRVKSYDADGGGLAGVLGGTITCGSGVNNKLNPGTYYNVRVRNEDNSDAANADSAGAILMVVVGGDKAIKEVQVTSGGLGKYIKGKHIQFADTRMHQDMAMTANNFCTYTLTDMAAVAQGEHLLKSVATGINSDMTCVTMGGGTCAVTTDGDNTGCSDKTTYDTCVGADKGTCAAPASPGVNTDCPAGTTTRALCAAADSEGNGLAKDKCVFTVTADDRCVYTGGCGVSAWDDYLQSGTAGVYKAAHHITYKNVAGSDGDIHGVRYTFECDIKSDAKVTVTKGGASDVNIAAAKYKVKNTGETIKLLAGHQATTTASFSLDCMNEFYYQFGFYSTGTPRWNQDLVQNNYDGNTPQDEQVSLYGMKNHMQYQFGAGSANMATDTFYGIARDTFTDLNSGMGTFDLGYSITEATGDVTNGDVDGATYSRGANDGKAQLTASVIAGENGQQGNLADTAFAEMMEHAEKYAYIGKGYDKLTVTPMPDAMTDQKVTLTYTGPSAGCSVTEVDRGTHESSECSGRGNCDYSTGTCLCDAGYTLEACSEQTVLV